LRLDGLLLAAGAGTRMGEPKALVHSDGRSWLRSGVSTLADGGCRSVTVVLGAQAPLARELVEDLDVSVVVAEDWSRGMSASLRAGLVGLDGGDADAAVVSLVDLPDLSSEVVARVAAAATGSGALVRATYQGEPGHPVVLGRDHWPAIVVTASGDHGARDYLAAHDVTLVECGDLATGRDVDTPTGT
jgi:CTP:molybdopterin cytidylyltransferase MocA